MLSLAKDYIPLEKRMAASVKTHNDVKEHEVALSFGLSRNYFSVKSKKNRLIKLLGGGDVHAGYTKYLSITETLIEEFSKMCQILDTRICGYEVFDTFAGYRHRYTTALHLYVQQNGISRYNRLHSVHKALKQFRAMERIRTKALLYIPIDKRMQITEKFLKKYYWRERMTTEQIAAELIVPEVWVQNAVTQLGMQKKKNGIRLRGRKGYVMPEYEKVKHRNQPHARAVSQICPRTFKVLRTFNSTGAVERDGWARENVRKAIKTVGLHDGFLWSYKGEEQNMIDAAKAKGNLEKKLRIWENGRIKREDIQKLYIDQDMSKEEVAKILGCHPCSVATAASRFRLLKRQNKLDKAELKRLYLEEGLQAKQIAPILGYTTKTISTYLSRYGFRKREKGTS